MECLPLLLEDDEDILIYTISKLTRTSHRVEKGQGRFELQKLSNDYCWIHFRFYKADLYRLRAGLKIPEFVKCRNGLTFEGIEGLFIMLKRLNYPSRLVDMAKFFPRTPCQISRILARTVSIVLKNNIHKITSLNHSWLTLSALEEFAHSLAAKGCPYKNCFGFLDGTVRPICRPTKNQRAYYNGHKKVHSVKFQSLHLPNGLIAHLSGPVHGRRHDSHLLQQSGLLKDLDEFLMPFRKPFHLYGDPAYQLHPRLIAPFQQHVLTPDKTACNKTMSSIRISVEWGFGKVLKYFGFLDFKKNLKIGLQPVHQYYQLGAILANCHTCFYGSQTSTYFSCDPPTFEEYLE